MYARATLPIGALFASSILFLTSTLAAAQDDPQEFSSTSSDDALGASDVLDIVAPIPDSIERVVFDCDRMPGI